MTTSAPTSAAGRAARGVPLNLRYALAGLVLVVDQLLLPMFHLGSIPFKPSYLILVLWALSRAASADTQPFARERQRDFARFAWAFAGIVACGLLGELAITASSEVANHSEAARSAMMYLLIVLAFGLGLNADGFKLKWLYWVFFVSAALNFSFILGRGSLPSWLVNFYYSERVVDAFSDLGVRRAEDILAFVRPRGIFPNPNGAMMMVNIVVLFIYVGLRQRLLPTPRGSTALGLMLFPPVLATLLATRGEFIGAVVVSIALYRVIRRDASAKWRRNATLVLCCLPVGLVASIGALDRDGTILENAGRIGTLMSVIERTADAGVDARNEGLTRPLLAWEAASSRFSYSPVFGTGYSSTERPPFIYGTQYFHNDWFRVAVTSGVIGLGLMLMVVVRYCLPLGYVVLLPFVVAGLTNTFILNIPATLFYFFMVAVFRQKLYARQRSATRATAGER